MTRGNKILLVALVVQVALAVVMLTRDRGGGMAALVEVAPKLVPTEVTKVVVSDGTSEVAMAASGADWTLTSHYGYPADKAKVVKLLTDLSVMKARGALSTGVARHAQLGVGDDKFERKVTVTTASGDRVFFIGKNAGGRQTAVRRGGESAVYGVAGISSYAIDPSPRAWIDPTYATVATDDVAAIDVQQGAALVSLDRTSGAWTLVENGGAPATVDAAKADNLLSNLGTITLAAPGDPALAGTPTAVITLRMKAPPGPATDAGVAASLPPPPPRIFDVLPAGDQYWLHERGNPRAAVVDKSTLDGLLGLSKATLAAPAPVPPPG